MFTRNNSCSVGEIVPGLITSSIYLRYKNTESVREGTSVNDDTASYASGNAEAVQTPSFTEAIWIAKLRLN